MALAQKTFYTEDDYYKLPDNIRAELIDGQFYNMSAPSRIHQEIVHFLDKKIGVHIDSKNGSCKVYPAPFAVKLFNKKQDVIVEPDISVICDKTKLTDRGCAGAPDWVIEIVSSGNPSHDYIRKLNLYAEAGVREYWIVDPRIEKVIVYYLEQADFRIGTYTFHDKIKVNIWNDLWIDFQELNL